MPDFTTHFLMARSLLFELHGEAADIAYRDLNAFYWGAQGPDPLYYYNSNIPETVRKQAFALHSANPSSIFLSASKNVLDTKGTKQWDQMLPFLFGFICHYCLDKNASPYIYSMQLRQKAKEPKTADELIYARLESAIDSALYLHYHKKPINDFAPAKFYSLDDLLLIAMSSFFYKLIRDVSRVQLPHDDISLCFNEMLEKNKAFYSPLGKFKMLPALIVDSLSGGTLNAHFKTMASPCDDILNLKKSPWANPWESGTQLRLSFVEIVENSVKEAKIMIDAFHTMLTTGNIRQLNLQKPFNCGNPAQHPSSARIYYAAAAEEENELLEDLPDFPELSGFEEPQE